MLINNDLWYMYSDLHNYVVSSDLWTSYVCIIDLGLFLAVNTTHNGLLIIHHFFLYYKLYVIN